MDYEKLYKEALERAKKELKECGSPDWYSAKQICRIFPELHESEDERIRRKFIEALKGCGFTHFDNDFTIQEAIAWLEKQYEPNPYSGVSFKYNGHTWDMCARDNGVDILLDKQLLKHLEKQGEKESVTCPICGWKIEKKGEQKPIPKFKIGDTMRTLQEAKDGYTDGMPVVVSIDEEYYHCTNELIAIKDQDDYEFPPINVKHNHADKVEPKFHEGDWVIDKQGIVHQIAKVIEIVTTHTYGYDIVGGGYFNDSAEGVRLWTIQDAKDGDVLYCKKRILDNSEIIMMYAGISNNIDSYCRYSSKSGFNTYITDVLNVEHDFIIPATKEQHDFLFQKMVEVGYKWDSNKKELIRM